MESAKKEEKMERLQANITATVKGISRSVLSKPGLKHGKYGKRIRTNRNATGNDDNIWGLMNSPEKRKHTDTVVNTVAHTRVAVRTQECVPIMRHERRKLRDRMKTSQSKHCKTNHDAIEIQKPRKWHADQDDDVKSLSYVFQTSRGAPPFPPIHGMANSIVHSARWLRRAFSRKTRIR